MSHNDHVEPEKPTQSNHGKNQDRRNRQIEITVAIITAIGLVFAALIKAYPWQHSNQCSNNLTISAPVDGRRVNGAHGVEVTGKACDMAGATGWLFDYDIDDAHYYMDYSTDSARNAEPIIANNGGWAYNDAPIGSQGDNNQTYSITAVLASPGCTKILERTKPDRSGNITFKNLPPGCTVDSSVAVDVTYP